MPSKKTCLIYAFGGGWGHLNRSLALARVAAAKYNIKIITNSQYLQQIDNSKYEFYLISNQEDFSQICDRVKQIILTTNYDLLVVDTFPRGLGGELKEIIPQIKQPKIFIYRYLNPRYIKQNCLEDFIAKNYHLTLIPGDDVINFSAKISLVRITAPWLIRNSKELANFKTAANILGLSLSETKSPLVIILASGYKAELAIYGNLANTLHQQGFTVRCLSAQLPENCPQSIWRFHYPAMECFWLADVVIGGGGYNTIYECEALNLPLVALPHKRLYDSQLNRILQQSRDRCFLATNRSEVIQITQNLLASAKPKPSQPPQFINGVEDAINAINNTVMFVVMALAININ